MILLNPFTTYSLIIIVAQPLHSLKSDFFFFFFYFCACCQYYCQLSVFYASKLPPISFGWTFGGKTYACFFPSRLGWIIRFISHSVISGFTTASAIVIALSQAKYFLGYDIVRSSEIIPLIKSIISGADEVCFLCQVTDPDEYLC